MDEYYAYDLSVPPDNDKTWNAEKEKESKEREQSFRDYFTTLAKSVEAEKQVSLGLPSVGFDPPVLQVFTSPDIAKKLEAESNGRIRMNKLELH